MKNTKKNINKNKNGRKCPNMNKTFDNLLSYIQINVYHKYFILINNFSILTIIFKCWV